MPVPVQNFIKRLTLAQQFMLASLVVLVAGMAGIGAWVGVQIETGVIHRAGATTALYVDSFVAPLIQEMGMASSLSPEAVDGLSKLLEETPLGTHIVAFKLWDTNGRVLFSNDTAVIGQTFPLEEGISTALSGQVSSEISSLEKAENISQRKIRARLLETYSPVRLSGSDQIIAVAEFYQTIDDLQLEVAAARRRSWLVVGAAMLAIYILLSGFVRRSSETIGRQREALREQVARLTELLQQNDELTERVRRAAASVTTLNERYLRRIGAELHDGPAQDLGLALLQLDAAIGRSEACRLSSLDGRRCEDHLTSVQSSLQHALKEVRAIAAGLSLPELAELSLVEAVKRVVRAHERRTGTKVDLVMETLPETAPLPLKITLYRLVQEALNNAARHAAGAGQAVRVRNDGSSLVVEVSDCGPGFEILPNANLDGGQHLGLAGMRERVESLGGLFRAESQPGKGVKIFARLYLQQEGADNE